MPPSFSCYFALSTSQALPSPFISLSLSLTLSFSAISLSRSLSSSLDESFLSLAHSLHHSTSPFSLFEALTPQLYMSLQQLAQYLTYGNHCCYCDCRCAQVGRYQRAGEAERRRCQERPELPLESLRHKKQAQSSRSSLPVPPLLPCGREIGRDECCWMRSGRESEYRGVKIMIGSSKQQALEVELALCLVEDVVLAVDV